ncbi:hypothetical protein EsH8_V_000743 [Colletotrichum jinshuiense]
MCLAENVYYTDCGCWEGHHVRWECPKAALAGAGCPDVSCSGVLRRHGRCLACRRREHQQKTLSTPQCAPLAGDGDLYRVSLLGEMLRRVIIRSEEATWSSGTDSGRDVAGADAAGGVSNSPPQFDAVFRTESTAWHHE